MGEKGAFRGKLEQDVVAKGRIFPLFPQSFQQVEKRCDLYALYKQRCFDKVQKTFALLAHFARQTCKIAAACAQKL